MTNEQKTASFGFASESEFIRKAGKLHVRDGFRVGFTRCFTCNNMCGLRYKVDERTGELMRVAGNPYCEVVTGGDPLPLKTSVAQAYELLSAEKGLSHRATTCGKGASGVDVLKDPRRVLSVLKRAGKRGENKWISIPYEQALKEILDGGDLFGEGHVDGLRAIRNTKDMVVPEVPEFGPKANQLFATFNEEDAIRGGFYSRFMTKAFGTVNLTTKHAYCGAAVGVGYSLGLAPEVSAGMCDVDWDNFEYALFIGTAPGSSGASINRLGRAVADARVDRKVKYACVDPILRDDVANNTNAQWVPILPGTDTAFLYGVIRLMIDEGWVNKAFLSNPNEAVAKSHKEINWTNATHLVDIETQTMAKASDFGIGAEDENVVLVDGKLVGVKSAKLLKPAQLEVDGSYTRKDGKSAHLVSSFNLLATEARRFSLDEYSKRCGVSIALMKEVAHDFTHHNRKVVAVSNTGNYAADAMMSSWLICILNTLVGSHDVKGGALYGNGSMMGFAGTYDLETVDSGFSQDGQMNVCRNAAYEESTEYKTRVAKGENPYPAKHLYHALFPGYTAGNAAEMLTALANQDPYPAKALINWRSNVLYSASSIDHRIEAVLADPKVLPLFVGIDAFINETNRYADYIIPDRVMYEEFACDRTWGNFHQCVVAGAPVVPLHTAKNAKGNPISMESFLIDVALAMQLPGFGKGAIPTKSGKSVDLLSYEDWAVRYVSNVAEQCAHLSKVTAEDRVFAGLDWAMKEVTPRLSVAEAKKVEALFSRGGYYERDDKYQGNFLKNGGGKFLQLFNPAVAQLKHCYSGENYPGVPVLRAPQFFNGDEWEKHWTREAFPLRFASYKPAIRSNYSVAFAHCVEASPENFIYVNELTAKALGIASHDKVRLESPNGIPVTGVVMCDAGVVPGAVCVAHTFGHSAYGAEDREVDGQRLPGIKSRAQGTAVNQMIPHDPTRPGTYSMLNDYWVMGNCRTGIPVRLVKIS
ncbi:MAG: molybdopterin-dependent oxidoreductase [Sutterella sp.]|nr:molybdopterin-dependent oxidoreductase [Sutterella sp.]